MNEEEEDKLIDDLPLGYMDGYLKDNLDTAKRVIKNDWDMIFAVDGYEGTGKSVFTMQCAYYCDPTLNIDRIVFTPKDFQKAVLSANKYESVVYDEAYTGLSSRAAMTMVNRILVKMLAEIRQKNLFIWIVMPTFFDLDKYVALWRSRALFHVYTAKNFRRGFFSFYNIDRKKELYVTGKKFYTYNNKIRNFFGRFTNYYPIDEEEYRKKKKNISIQRENEAVEQQMKIEVENRLFLQVMNSGSNLTHEQKANILGIPISTYYYKLRKYEESSQL